MGRYQKTNVASLWIQHFQLEAELASMTWKIRFEDIINTKQGIKKRSGSRQSLNRSIKGKGVWRKANSFRSLAVNEVIEEGKSGYQGTGDVEQFFFSGDLLSFASLRISRNFYPGLTVVSRSFPVEY
ncbi:hypothetical protein CEXT_117281 [Caerostris extrusa]|uniref:Uncharacterized protein n=1 Tax=Caerostris extrusa TaxID=172846 RepID=A0AAV4NQL3_CAEEX|nr:hypothetical protein CEXT_117281 [Caerostris extrusa]